MQCISEASERKVREKLDDAYEEVGACKLMIQILHAMSRTMWTNGHPE